VAPRRSERHQNVEALFIRDYFRRWLARFDLGAHLLDLSCLLFELRRENLHLFLLQGDSRFQVSDTGLLFLDFFVFLEELVEQHHGHLFIVGAWVTSPLKGEGRVGVSSVHLAWRVKTPHLSPLPSPKGRGEKGWQVNFIYQS